MTLRAQSAGASGPRRLAGLLPVHGTRCHKKIAKSTDKPNYPTEREPVFWVRRSTPCIASRRSAACTKAFGHPFASLMIWSARRLMPSSVSR